MPRFGDHDKRWMAAAIALAQRGLGRVWPNPAVGSVIVAGNRVLGRGWTQPGGRPHAETMALAQAGDAAKGAAAYISLEPCAHHGKTPPCVDALITAGIARVIAPMADPDPRVAGKGFERLRAAGIAVETGLMVPEAEAMNIGFLTRQRSGRPWLTLKIAATLDGRIATASGESRWITGSAAREAVHLMRARHDAVLIGAGTARADDPQLDVRLNGLSDNQPVRIIVDSGLSLSPTSRLGLASADGAPVWRIAAEGQTGWGDIIDVPRLDKHRLDLTAALAALGQRGLTRILCEGGGTLAGSLLRAGLVDELIWMSAGKAIGNNGVAAIGPLNVLALSDAPTYQLVRTHALGNDLMSVWQRP